MNPAILIAAGIGALALLTRSSKAEPAPAAPKDKPKDEGASKGDEARKLAEEQAKAAREEADAARAEAEKAKADAAAAAELKPLSDAVIYAASAMGKEPFRVQTINPAFSGRPIGASILAGIQNKDVAAREYEWAILLLQNERQERIKAGLPLRAELLSLKRTLAAYAEKLFGAPIAQLPDAEEKPIGAPIDPLEKTKKVESSPKKAADSSGVVEACEWAESFVERFAYQKGATSGANGQPIGPWVVKYALSPSAKLDSMNTVVAMLAAEVLNRSKAGKAGKATDSMQSLISCVKAERARRFGW